MPTAKTKTPAVNPTLPKMKDKELALWMSKCQNIKWYSAEGKFVHWMGCSQTVFTDGMYAICYEFASIKRALEVEFPKTYAFPDDKTIFWALMHLEHLRNSGEGSTFPGWSYTIVATIKEKYYRQYSELLTTAGFRCMARFQNLMHNDYNVMLYAARPDTYHSAGSAEFFKALDFQLVSNPEASTTTTTLENVK
jgi:hypothetical protein